MSAVTVHTEAVERYFAAWNATEPDRIAAAVSAAWTPDGGYTDPTAEVVGRDRIAELIAGVHRQFPGFTFRPVGTADGHHDVVRFGWELVSPADGSAPVAGFDVLTLAEDGRIRAVSGFLDRVPAGVG
ncbi:MULTISPECIES: nuclear transport factor 2 family protein [unclassified Frankia]|uniref:nuclear transport factor 2 family protein n=1 Tax=Frankia TaxID=1854 RepID=UPI0005D0F3F5|nr:MULTISPECIES: nuclear transport factor 2 family protein [unclassified Frankia]KQC38421.1 polyketide cyclase [Frankia sp. ACN1ag]